MPATARQSCGLWTGPALAWDTFAFGDGPFAVACIVARTARELGLSDPLTLRPKLQKRQQSN